MSQAFIHDDPLLDESCKKNFFIVCMQIVRVEEKSKHVMLKMTINDQVLISLKRPRYTCHQSIKGLVHPYYCELVWEACLVGSVKGNLSTCSR